MNVREPKPPEFRSMTPEELQQRAAVLTQISRLVPDGDVACGMLFDAGRRIEELESAQRRMLAGHIGPMSVLATLRARCMTEGAIQIEMKDLLY